MNKTIPFKQTILLAAVAGLFAILVLFITGGFQILHYYLAYSYYLNILTSQAGLNPWLAKAFTLVLIIPLAYGLKLIFNWKKKRRTLGWGLIIGYFVVFNLLMFSFTHSNYFDMAEGKATKYYALTPEGYRFFDAPGFDPKYGIKLSPVTPEVAALAENPTVQPKQYFDPLTGKPLAWYAKRPEGIALFSMPGFDPVTGDKLRSITKEVAEAYAKEQTVKAVSHDASNTVSVSSRSPNREHHVIELKGDMPNPNNEWAGYTGLIFDPQKGEFLKIRTTVGAWYHSSLNNEFFIPPGQDRIIRFNSLSGLYLFSKESGQAEITAFR